MIVDLALVAFFLSAMVALMTLSGLIWTLSGSVIEKRRVGKTLELATTDPLTAAGIERTRLSVPFLDRVAVPVLARIARFTRRVMPAGVLERLQGELLRAGLQARWDAGRVMAAKLAALGVLSGLAVLAGLVLHLTALQGAVVIAAAGAAGYYIPEWQVRSRAGARQTAIRRALPDALDLLAITVEAGLGFDAAVQRVAQRAGGPLSEELGRLLHELQIGRGRSAALRDLGERTGVQELRSFCLAMVQADTFGISIAKMLHEQAHEVRVRRRQLAEEKAQKVGVKIVFPLLLCIFPSMFVVLLGPAMISIYQNLFHR